MNGLVAGKLRGVEAEFAPLVYLKQLAGLVLFAAAFLSMLRCCFADMPLEYISKI